MSICNEQYIVRLNVAQLRYKQDRIEGGAEAASAELHLMVIQAEKRTESVDRAFLSTRSAQNRERLSETTIVH